MIYLALFLASYLAGSLPTAYLLVRWTQHSDIRTQGSGNVGATNALRVTKKKWLGLIVLLIDLAKGLIPAWWAVNHYPHLPWLSLPIMIGIILGHSFPIWLKFKGGRGLAVAAGGFLIFNYWIVIIWLSIWLVFFVIIRKHIVASLIATFILPIALFFMRLPNFDNELLLTTLIVALFIFQRHLERIPDLVEQKRQSINKEVANGT